MSLDKFTLEIKLQAIDRESTKKYKQHIIKDATRAHYIPSSLEDMIYAITVYNRFYTTKLVGVKSLRTYISKTVRKVNPEDLKLLPEMPLEHMPNSNDFDTMLLAPSIPTYMKVAALKEQYRKEQECNG